MRAIVNTGPGRLEMQELPTPVPGPGEVRVRTAACGICATDLVMVSGWERTGFPSVPGHEWSGFVDDVGEAADSALLGQRCVAENVLADGGEVGFEHSGGYAEYFITEADNVHVLPGDFPPTVAALIEPLAVAVRGLRRLRDDAQPPFLVFGDGPIGLLVVMLAIRNGAGPVTLVGGREPRLALARELGAEQTLNYHTLGDDLAAAILQQGEARFPSVIEASGSVAGMEAAFEVAANCGRVLLLGDYGQGRAGFRWIDLLIRELELIGSNASAGAWPEALRLAVGGELPLERLVTHVLPADRFAEGVEMTRSGRDDLLKVVLEWGVNA